ncbi:conserved hypothetical protein [Bathymodiolus platifrons methanotrophic gill symbiont]|uniref:hypothetical protein n=1 Tax=Bathymodiolus platifrons methanotrophic gill symbiont TaxID=113268 RepID=UPI000B422AD6|nr:hypothetical protein [Bathymodiolus platifrons methanotrophic gill symbiont]GAW86436.1 conserved hypothetical protein [Bathymodiolus platifrons methanotrophic gill symbiont]
MLAEQSLGRPLIVYEIELRERMVRVEEALKNQGEEFKAQRELIQHVLHQMDKRFEQVDKRFGQMQEQSGKHFDQMDKRFEQMQEQSDKRFDQVDKRFEQVHQEILQIHRDMRQLNMWSIGIILSIVGLGIAIFRLI